MPLRHQPSTLQQASMVSIARNFDYICYHAKTREEMCAMIYDESYLKETGPFQQLREYLSVCMYVCVCMCVPTGAYTSLEDGEEGQDKKETQK